MLFLGSQNAKDPCINLPQKPRNGGTCAVGDLLSGLTTESIGGCELRRRNTLLLDSQQHNDFPQTSHDRPAAMIDESDLAEIWMRLDRARDSSFTTAAFVLAALIVSVLVVKVRKQRQRDCMTPEQGCYNARTDSTPGTLSCLPGIATVDEVQKSMRCTRGQRDSLIWLPAGTSHEAADAYALLHPGRRAIEAPNACRRH